MELTPLAVVLLFPICTLFWAKRRLPPGESLWKKLTSPTHNWGAIQCTYNILNNSKDKPKALKYCTFGICKATR